MIRIRQLIRSWAKKKGIKTEQNDEFTQKSLFLTESQH